MGPSPLTVRSRIFLAAALIAIVGATGAWWPHRFQWLADGIIVPPSRAYDFGYRAVDGYWRPSRAQVAAVARALPALVRSHEGRRGCLQEGRSEQLGEYVHIYTGIIADGRKLIAVQLEHRSHYEHLDLVDGKLQTVKQPWTTPIYVPNDGDNELDTRYDVAAGTFGVVVASSGCSIFKGNEPDFRRAERRRRARITGLAASAK